MNPSELKNLFEQEYSTLTGRARSFLHSLELDSYSNFYTTIITERKILDFNSIHNCGIKTTLEIEDFIRRMISCAGKENDFKFSNDITQNWIFELKFQNLVNGCPPATKKFLKTKKITNLQKFNDTFIKGMHPYNSESKIRIPSMTCEHLDFIKRKLFEADQQIYDYENSKNLFALLQFLLFENCFTRDIENAILKHYLLFLKDNQYLTLKQIGNKFNLSGSRISIIADLILITINKTLDGIKQQLKASWQDYIQEDVFIADPSWEEKINQKENTTLSNKFMAYAILYLYKEMPYIFIEIPAMGKFNDILFIRDDLNFDFSQFFEDIKLLFGYQDPMKSLFPVKQLESYFISSQYLFRQDNTNLDELVERIRKVGNNLSLEIKFDKGQESLLINKVSI